MTTQFGCLPQPSPARARMDAAGYAFQRAQLDHQRAQFEAKLPKVVAEPEQKVAKPKPPKRDWLLPYAESTWPPSWEVFLRAQRILGEVSSKHGIGVLDIKSERRSRPLVRARHEAMWRLKNETPWSLPKIGKFLGDRDHTTVLHGVRKHQQRIDAGEA